MKVGEQAGFRENTHGWFLFLKTFSILQTFFPIHLNSNQIWILNDSNHKNKTIAHHQ
jgi:hypothetical protein